MPLVSFVSVVSLLASRVPRFLCDLCVSAVSAGSACEGPPLHRTEMLRRLLRTTVRLAPSPNVMDDDLVVADPVDHAKAPNSHPAIPCPRARQRHSPHWITPKRLQSPPHSLSVLCR